LFPATYPDIILMGGKAVDRDNSQFTLQHTSWSLRHGRVISEGDGKLVAFDYKKGNRVDVPPIMLAAIDSLESRNCEHMLEHFESIIKHKTFEE
jgi:acyl-CoA thioesterase FadM